MTSIAASERSLLCTLAQQLGPDAPTLSGDWTVKQLVVHLLLRERSPAVVGVVVKPLAGVLDRAMEKHSHDDFADLVEKLRHGPPKYSPFALPVLGDKANLLEFFVHHEDVRRAQPDWQPRSLSPAIEDGIWGAIRVTGRGLAAKSRVGVSVVAERSDSGARTVLRKGGSRVLVRGLPSEITLYLFGRKAQAQVELDGAPEDIARLESTALGI